MNSLDIVNYAGAFLMGIGSSILWGIKGLLFGVGLYMVINSSFAKGRNSAP